MTQLDDIYSTRILELVGQPSAWSSVAGRCRTGRRPPIPKLCGSTVTVDLKMAGNQVSAYGQTVKACLLGQAAASVMGHNIIGSSARELRREVGGPDAPHALARVAARTSGKWIDLAVLEPVVRTSRAGMPSTLLVFDAVEAALAQAEAKQQPAPAEPARA